MRRLVFFIILGVALAAHETASAQESPDALGADFLQAVQQRDRAALLALVHPASIRAVGSKRLDQVLDNWLKLDVQPSWSVRSLATDSLHGYDEQTWSYQFGPVTVVFPARPERFLVVSFARPANSQMGGSKSAAVLSGEKTRDAIARHEGRWRIIIGESCGRKCDRTVK